MIVKNEYIKIKNGKKTTTLHNYIYDEYLSLFSKTQYEIDEETPFNTLREQQKKVLDTCFIRFDTPVEDIKNVELSDFELSITSYLKNFLGNKNRIDLTYEYDFANAWNMKKLEYINKSDYYNKKITTIGFGDFQSIYACIDVSNYNIVVLENEELFISRKDIITTQALCYNYEFPVHLSPVGDIKNGTYDTFGDYEPIYSKLYSIGLAKTIGVENEEYIIGEDIDVKIKDDTSFSFNIIKGEDQSIYPQNNLYTGNNKYPLPFYIQKELYPKTNLYTSNNLFPLDSNYKYIFYKFRLYTVHWNGTDPKAGYLEIKWLDEYYTMYLKNNTKGLFEIVTKIERSDD